MATSTVIVTSFNGLEYSKIFYESYKYFTKNPAVKLAWVDNASTDGTVEWLEDQSMIDYLFLNPINKGAGASRNQAATEVDSDCVIFVDNDIRITQVGWTNRLIRKLYSDKNNIGAVAPAINLVFDDAQARSLRAPLSNAITRLSKYGNMSSSTFHHEEDVWTIIVAYLNSLKEKPFPGSIVLEGGGTTIDRELFLEICYPDDFRIQHTGAYLGKGLRDRHLQTWVVPSVFLFHYGHATRNYKDIPDLKNKMYKSTVKTHKWKGLL